MGYNACNDEIHENLERMRREREAYEDSLAIVRQFNARLSAKKTAWFWPNPPLCVDRTKNTRPRRILRGVTKY